MSMDAIGYTGLGLVCVTVMYLPAHILNKIAVRKLLKETEAMHIRRRREDLLFEYAISAMDIPVGDIRWMLMLHRAQDSDEEMRKAFPKEKLQELAPLISQRTLTASVR